MATLAFNNLVQLVIWDNELSGQISDGNWENAAPHDHYRPWCKATAIIDPANPGRDFYARKQNYNFTAPELLSAVGPRIAYRMGLALVAPEAVKKLIAQNVRLPEADTDWIDPKHDFERVYIEKWTAAGLPQTCQPVSTKEMKRVLNEMKAIIKMSRAVQKTA